jgi:hypothetical protein
MVYWMQPRKVLLRGQNSGRSKQQSSRVCLGLKRNNPFSFQITILSVLLLTSLWICLICLKLSAAFVATCQSLHVPRHGVLDIADTRHRFQPGDWACRFFSYPTDSWKGPSGNASLCWLSLKTLLELRLKDTVRLFQALSPLRST